MCFVEEKMLICIDFVKYYMSWKNIAVSSIKDIPRQQCRAKEQYAEYWKNIESQFQC